MGRLGAWVAGLAGQVRRLAAFAAERPGLSAADNVVFAGGGAALEPERAVVIGAGAGDWAAGLGRRWAGASWRPVL